MSSSHLPPALVLPLPAGAGGDTATADARAEVVAVFDACAVGLRRYVATFGLTAHDIDDVTQEVFMSLFRHLERGRPRHNLRGWVFKVGHNLALKHRHRAQRTHQRLSSIDADVAETLADPAMLPDVRLLDRERQTQVRAVLRALPDRDRRCFYLRAEGLPYREIAAVLQMSLGGVAKSLARTVGRLMNADEGEAR